jgi:hypothetical protein
MNSAEWCRLYLAAISETDASKIPTRIQDAEVAMFSQIANLTENSDLNRERDAIANAFAILRALERVSLRYR